MYIYIYIYIERERERKRKKERERKFSKKIVTSKFQTTLPHVHAQKYQQETHSHTEEN